MSSCIITIGQLIARTGLNRSDIKNEIDLGKLAKPVPLGPWSTGWDKKDLEKRITDRESAGTLETIVL